MDIQCYSSGEYYYFTNGKKYFTTKILGNYTILEILEKDLSNMERIDFNSIKEEKRNLIIEKFLQ